MNQTPFIRADSTPHVFVSADYREHTMTKIVPVRETSGVPQVTGDFARYVEQKEELQWHNNERDGVSNPPPPPWLFAEAFMQAQIKENIKTLGHRPLCREFTGHQ